jgi:hypothetical protein
VCAKLIEVYMRVSCVAMFTDYNGQQAALNVETTYYHYIVMLKLVLISFTNLIYE